MFYKRAKIKEGETIDLGSETVDIDITHYGDMRAVTTGKKKEYLINSHKTTKGRESEFTIPNGARWLGMHRNPNVETTHIWFAIETSRFEGLQVSDE